MVGQCRIKMFTRLTKGGTQYDQKNQRGTIIDGFSNNLTQLLIFAQVSEVYEYLICTQVLSRKPRTPSYLQL